MITEIALLNIKKGSAKEFEEAFAKAQALISSVEGYITHELHQCFEDAGKYLLLVKWSRLEDHTVGFRQSAAYKEWKKLLHHFYDPFPVVEHYKKII